MKFKLKINRKEPIERLQDTHNNVVIKLDSDSVKRMHNLSLNDAQAKYNEILKNLTSHSN